MIRLQLNKGNRIGMYSNTVCI